MDKLRQGNRGYVMRQLGLDEHTISSLRKLLPKNWRFDVGLSDARVNQDILLHVELDKLMNKQLAEAGLGLWDQNELEIQNQRKKIDAFLDSTETKDPYIVLGVPKGSSSQVIEAAFTLARFHCLWESAYQDALIDEANSSISEYGKEDWFILKRRGAIRRCVLWEQAVSTLEDAYYSIPRDKDEKKGSTLADETGNFSLSKFLGKIVNKIW